MQVDRPRLDDLLTQIAQKKIDSDTAARLLLGLVAQSAPPQSESMLALVNRFGPPPPEVEEDWTRQIRAIAQSWLDEQKQPLPELTLEDWLIDSDNRVTLSPHAIESCRRQTLSSHAQAATSQSASAVTLTESAPAPSLSGPVESSDSTDLPVKPSLNSVAVAHVRKPSPHRTRPQTAIVVSIAGAAVALLILVAVFRGADEEAMPLVQPQTNRPVVATPLITPSATYAQSQPSVDDPTQLQASVIQQAEPEMPLAPVTPTDLLRPDFGLDNPLLGGLAIGPTVAKPENGSNVATEISASAIAAVGPSDDQDVPMDADSLDPDSGDVKDQTVLSASPRQAVTLPPLRSAANRGPNDPEKMLEQTAVVGTQPVRDVHWDFPNQINVQFAASQDNSNPDRATKRWAWIDSNSGEELATLQQVQQELLFRWSEHALGNPLARQLSAGRLRVVDTTGQPSVVFMRPHLRTAPLRLEAGAADARFNWPLEGPAIYDNPLLNLEVTKPENVDLAWIESPDPNNIRKQTATLQWTPAGKPSPAIRCQIDTKANTKLQMRLRYFAQLDSTFPWQPYSSTHLTLALDQVTQLLERRASDLSQLEQQYRNATTSEKRSIRPVKENVEKSVNQLQALLQRLQNLNILHSAIVSASYLQCSLTTQWPDGLQTILEIPPPDQ